MKQARIRWSWLALALTIMPLGGVLVFGMYFTQMFREGLDADMTLSMLAQSPLEIVAGMALMGATLLPFVVLGWWLTRWSGADERRFVLLVAGLPTLILALVKVGTMVVTDYLIPSLGYLPNWLELITFAAAFSAAALTYVRVARLVPVKTRS